LAEQALELSEEGYPPALIASKLKLSLAEVELALRLKK
jgi:hypothetical protein